MMSRVHKNNFHDVLSHCQITVVGPFDLQHPVSRRRDTESGLDRICEINKWLPRTQAEVDFTSLSVGAI